MLTSIDSGRSRMRESRTYGSVRAKAEWLSYSTNIVKYAIDAPTTE